MKALNKKEKTYKIKLSFALEEGKGRLVAKSSVNCDCRDGKLCAAPAGQPFLNSDNSSVSCDVANAARIFLIKEYNSAGEYVERFAVLEKSGRLFIQKAEKGSFLLTLSGLGKAEACRVVDKGNRSKLVFLSPSGCVFLERDYSTNVAILENPCQVGSFFKHRLFAGVKPAGIACNAPGDELDFTESLHGGGLLHFPCVGGEVVAIRPFEDKLYVFFEYGILKLNVRGAVKDFEAEEIAYAGGKIYGRTVCATSNAVFFMAEDGLYRFNGTLLKKLHFDFLQIPKEETLLESGVCYGDKVLLRYMTQDGYKTLAVYADGKDGFYMDGLDALTSDEGGRCLFIGKNNQLCKLSEDGTVGNGGEFSGVETDFGFSGRKTLTKLVFEGTGKVSVRMENGGRFFSRVVTLTDGRAEISLSERGEKFIFHFTLTNGTKITSAVAEIKTVG